MTDQLTPTQTLLMWGVLAKQGIAKQADIMPTPKAPDRKTLETAKLISSSKISRSLWLKLEDKGWGWAADHLRDPLPPAQGALRDMMNRLHDDLERSGKTLGDFIGAASAPDKSTSILKPASNAQVSIRSIKAAYAKASGQKAPVRVFLSDLKRHHPPIEPSKWSQALCKAHLDGKITLMRLDNPAEMTAAVRAARIDFKGEPMYLVWIEK